MARRKLNAASRRLTQSQINAAVATAAIFLAHANSARATDIDTISQRVTSQLLSSIPSTKTINGYVSTLQSNGSWTDVDYTNTAQTNWVPLTHLQRLEAMAQLYVNTGSSNTTLAADISSAYNFWISANPTSTNWFDNDIAAPQALGSTMVLVKSILSPTQIASGQTILGRAKADISHETGQNVVDEAIAGIDSAIVSGSGADMASAFGSIGGTITIVAGNGIQADYTYQFHGPQLYMGGYGSSYINDTLNWSSIGAGTAYAITPTQEKLLVDYLLNGTQWFIRGQTLDLAADGRQVTFPSYVGAGDNYVGAIQNALALGNYRTAELQAFLARQNATISAGAANSSSNNLSGNRAFFDSDAMVQQRPAYYASVKVTSTRTSQPETGNNQGLENLYLGDGVNQIMVTGNEYLGIQPSWNWRRLPGITVEQDTRSLTPSGTFGAVKGTTTYAGGVSDNTYGAEAFNYSRFDVAAKKSWFFFDNEEVALGAAIKSSNASFEVDTTLNQTLLTSTVSYETTAGPTIQTLTTGAVTPANLKWVYQGGVGYFFITPVSNATIQAIAQSGTWSALNTAASSATVTQNVFTLYINHGAAVSNGAYSYIAVPGIAASGMDAYLASNPIQVLRNDANVQAVRQSALDLTEAAFYAADSFAIVPGQTLGVSGASTVMLQRQPNTLKLSASSPQSLQESLQLSLSNVSLSGPSATWLDALGTGIATFNLPGGIMAGSTVGVTLASNGAATPTVSLTSNDQGANSAYTVTAPVALPANTTFSTDGFSTLSFSSTVSGSASITKIGAGALLLSGPNTFTNGLTINGGTVRATSPGALGSTAATVNNGGLLVVGSSPTTPIILSGGTLAFTGSPSMPGNLTAAPSTTSTIEIFDPATPTTPINVSFTGNLLGTGNIILANAAGTTSPDGGQAFRINGTNAGSFTGTITLSNNVKGELFGTTSGLTTPAGTGKIILTAGDAAFGGTLNTLTTAGGYSELNLRNNTSGNQIYGNNVQVTGSGLTLINPLGTAPAGASVTLGNLQIGGGQQLGTYLAASSVSHPVLFQSVSLTGGIATFSPKTPGFGAANSTGADLTLGNINETVAGSGITMAGLRTLFLAGNNAFTGGLNINSGTVQIDNAGALNTTTPQSISFGATASGGTLDLNGFNVTVSGLTVAAGATGSVQIIGNSSTTTNSTLTFARGVSTFAGTIQDTISPGNKKTALAVAGGNLILSGTSTYTGGTSINAGATLTLALGGTLPAAAAITNNGTLVLNNPNVILGALAGTNPAAVVALNANNLTLSSLSSYAGIVADNNTAAALNVNANSSLGSLQLATLKLNSANLQIQSTGKISSLNLLGSTSNGTGTLDLAGNKLILETSPAAKASALAILRSQINYAGYSQFTSTTGQIISTALPANEGLALIDNASLPTPFTTFGGLPADPNSLLLSPELLGDTNADDNVNLTDLSTVLNNFGVPTIAWTAGNFDGNTTIDLTDLSTVLNNFGLTNPNASASPVLPTPEPASLLLITPLLLLLRRKFPLREHICART